jgi:TRAP-type C4-dicarboxylate transport system substrate-binding protein
MKDKRLLVLCLTICLLVVLVMPFTAGCAQPAKTTKLIFASFLPPPDPSHTGLEAFAEDLIQKSGGKIEVEYSYGGAIGGQTDLFDRLQEGVCDVAVVLCISYPGRFPLSEVLTLPVYSPEPSSTMFTKAFYDLREKGFLDKEYADVVNLYGWGMSVTTFNWSKEPVTTIEGFRGKKIKVSGGVVQQVVEALGAVPVALPAPELYGALQKGTVDGGAIGYSIFPPFKFQEVVKYVTCPNIMSSALVLLMNKDSYNKLPRDIRGIIDDMAASDKYGLITAQAMEDSRIQGRELFMEAGGREDILSNTEMAKMEPLLAPLWTDWIADKEAKGLPAKDMLADLYAFLKSQGVETPFVGYTPGP